MYIAYNDMMYIILDNVMFVDACSGFKLIFKPIAKI